ncbi:MAG TPA: hypothetical protein VK404_06495, partial [Spirosoma sp.]|nr:hypothetical protein [Spirosoma sp.]
MKHTLPYLFATAFTLGAHGMVGAQVPSLPGRVEQRPAATIPSTRDDTPHGNAKLTGVVVDSTTGKPVEFASIAL